MDKNSQPTQNKIQHAMLQQLTQAFVSIPFNQMLGLKLDHLDTKNVIMSFNMKNELIGNFMQGILHGGVISSVLDMAGGILVMASVVSKNSEASIEELGALLGKCSTIDLQVNYLRPGKGERFSARGELVKSGVSISFTRMELRNQDDVMIAMGSGTYISK